MFWLGLIVAVCFVPGYTGAIIPTQWAVFSILLPLGLWRSGVLGPIGLLGPVVFAFAALSITWAPNPWDAGFGLWLMCLWALAMWFGTTVNDFRPLWRGLAVGLTVSSVVAIFQRCGFSPVLSVGDTGASGLLYNSVVLGASCALVLIALWTQRLWWYMPGLLPGLMLANSRGAYLVLGLTLATRFMRLRYIFLALAFAAIAFTIAIQFTSGDSDYTRLLVWGAAMRELTLFGRGIGSFSTFFVATPQKLLYPGWVHNDYLQLWFELGIGSLAIVALYALALTQRTSDHWPIFFAFAIFGTFSFPLWTPISAFMGCVVAGAMLRDRYLDRLACIGGRYSSLPGVPRPFPVFPRLGRKAVPTASAN